MFKVGIYIRDKRGGPYVRAKLLEKYIPWVECFYDVNKAKDYDLLDLQFQIHPKLFNSGIPFIQTFHGFVDYKNLSNWHSKLAMYRWKYWHKQSFKKAKRIIAVSHEAKRQLIKFGIKENNIKIIYGGIELDKYTQKKVKDPDEMLFLNSLEKYENLDVILKALKYGDWLGYDYEWGSMSAPPFVLNVYGYGRKEKEYEKFINKYLLPVNIKEEVDNKEIMKQFKETRCLIQSCINETWGYPICEAMATGTIAIVSDIPSHRKNFKNVLFFKPNDYKHLAKLIKEVMVENKHRELIPRALKEVEKYDVKKFIKETKTEYEKALFN